MDLKILQSNIEGIIIDYIQDAYLNKYTHIIINAGAYSHTSIGIHDALKIFGDNVFEVHLSNIHSREDFRSISYISKVSKGVICGFQEHGYLMALDYIHKS